jgi:cyanophycin synthetase
MAALCDGEVIFFAASIADDVATAEAIAAHRAQGGRAVLVHDGVILLATGDQAQPLLTLANLPALTAQGKIGASDTATNEKLTPFLAAIGAAWALNVPLATLRTGIETF